MPKPHNIQACLRDILTSIAYIEEDLGEKRDFRVYQRNRRLRQVVERNLEIIGEAMNRILKIDPDFPIQNARKIVDLRNWVIHTYEAIDDEHIWAIVTRHLPQLKTEVERLMAEFDS